MKVRDLVPDAWSGRPMKIRDLFSHKDLAAALAAKVTAQTITIKNSSTNEIIGKRTIYQK